MSKTLLKEVFQAGTHLWRVREAEKADLDTLYRLYQRIGENDAFNEQLSRGEFRTLFGEIQQDPDKHQYLLVDDKSTVAGMIELLYVSDRKLKDNPTLGEENRYNTIIEFIGIDPAFQGQRLSSHLLQHALIYARQHQSPSVRVDVHRKNRRAVALYESAGFERIGEHKTIEMLKLAYDLQ